MQTLHCLVVNLIEVVDEANWIVQQASKGWGIKSSNSWWKIVTSPSFNFKGTFLEGYGPWWVDYL